MCADRDEGQQSKELTHWRVATISHLIGTLKPQSNGRNTVICTLAVDGWAVTFGAARRGQVEPSTANVPTSYY